MINGIHHVSINVKNVQESVQFYVDLLGMEQISRPDLGFPGAWLKSAGHEVHLLGIDSTPPPKEQHFAFAVDDVAAVKAAVEAAGLRSLNDDQKVSYELEDGRDGKKSAGSLALL